MPSVIINDTCITNSELIDRVPEYVVKLMAGARVVEKWGEVEIREIVSDGSVFKITEENFKIIERIWRNVEKLMAVQ